MLNVTRKNVVYKIYLVLYVEQVLKPGDQGSYWNHENLYINSNEKAWIHLIRRLNSIAD